MWLGKLVLALVAARTVGWECGVTQEKEETYRHLQSGKALQRGSTLAPIRLFAYYGDMSGFSTGWITRFKTLIMPSTIAYYAKTLSIYPLTENWVTEQTTCGTQSVPSDHRNIGLPNVDVVIYMSSSYDYFNNLVSVVAICDFDGGNSRGSPIAGAIKLNAVHYDDLEVEQEIQMIRHQIAHILAFSGPLFPRFRRPDGSLYSAPVVNSTARGNQVSLLTTPTVLAKAQAAFGCSTLSGIELENEGTSAGSHWEKRIMMNDFMTEVLMKNPIYSDITLAVFEDSGWYKVNYTRADPITFGKDRGCAFITTGCQLQGVPQFPEFCASGNNEMCGDFHTRKSYCSNGDELVGNCPYVEPYINGDCTGIRSRHTPTLSKDAYGEMACPSCRCFIGTYAKGGYSTESYHTGCHQVTCSNGKASVLIGNVTVQCSAEGGQISSIPGYSGHITCPSYGQICGKTYCPNNCYRNGNCVNGQCVCFDGFSGQDCSSVCHLSCKTCTGPEAGDCSSCYAQAMLADKAPSPCKCPSGTAPQPTAANCKYTCHETCETCSGPGVNECSSCFAQAILAGTAPNVCKCVFGAAPQPTAANCEVYTCHPTCLTCSGPGVNECSSCYPHAILAGMAPSSCQCASGTLPQPTAANCEVYTCHETCLTCSAGDPYSCTSCYPSAVAQGPTFPSSCICAVGFAPDPHAGHCLPCDLNCRICWGVSAFECSGCYPNAVLFWQPSAATQTCLCVSGFYLAIDAGNCRPCDSSCLTCTGPSPTNCSSCAKPAILIENTHCGQVCPDGQIAINTVCVDNNHSQGNTNLQENQINFVPIALISALLVAGLLSSLLFLYLDRNHLPTQPLAVTNIKLVIDTRSVRDPEARSALQLSCDIVELPRETTVSRVIVNPPTCGKLLLESHCVSGLIWHSTGLERWMKTAILTATLVTEMAFIGARYSWENKDRTANSEIWAQYCLSDFLYCLYALLIGLIVGSVLTALFSLATQVESTLRKALLAVSVLSTVLVASGTATMACYLAFGLSYGEGGRWAVSLMPTLAGELVICQTCRALARTTVLKCVGNK